METKNLEDLKANKKNPRRISSHDFEALKTSIMQFGDLSGVVFNQTTGQLVGGHMRTEAFKRLGGQKRVVVVERFPQPTKHGTVAVGYIDYENEHFSYREVQWDEAREKSANIAANRIQGEFDLDILSEITHELSQLEDRSLLDMTGQTEDEIERMLKMSGSVAEPEPEQDDSEKLEFRVSREQREIVEEALGNVLAKHPMGDEPGSSKNGSALFFMARSYLDRLHGLEDEKKLVGGVVSTAEPILIGNGDPEKIVPIPEQ